MDADVDDAQATAPCDKCELSIPRDADRCPICGYQPAGYDPRLVRVGEVFFTLTAIFSVFVFVAGVTRFAPGLPTDAVSQAAIVTPYTTGVSGFFVYYLHGKRRTKPTDSDAFDQE